MFKTTPISRAYESTAQTVYKAPGGGMARGELRSTLSRAGLCRCRRSCISCQKSEKEKKNFILHSAFTIFAKNGVFSKNEEMSAR